jgi:3D-(3,5/4)-trihydroxycyclohexane-1,2-dione acylhydrolase (decyclizing)
VLLLPGDTFATRRPHPVLQQLEVAHDGTISVNDCLRPVSRYFDRVARAEQLIPAALEAMRVLTDPAETGAVTLALPEDVQVEAFEVPDEFLGPRVWTVYRRPPAPDALARAAALIRAAERPLLVAGGGVIYSAATRALQAFVEQTGIPVGETQAGRGALRSDHRLALGALGATGTVAANRLARDADVVIGVGTRWSDFTTASKSAFQDPGVRFVNINVAGMDAAKHSALALEADARLALDALRDALGDHRAPAGWEAAAAAEALAYADQVEQLVAAGRERPLRQASVIGAVNDAAGERGVVVCAAGSLPGDLHKLWRARDPDGKGYHVEYGYSCMGYEIPGGIGVRLAAPDREVFVMVGDGSYMMGPTELATAVAERIHIVVVLLDNHGFASIGALSRSLGSAGFGTIYRRARDGDVALDAADGSGPAGVTEALPIDLAANAESLGATVLRARDIDELRAALARAGELAGPVVIAVETDRYASVAGEESWWDVPVAEVSEMPAVASARAEYERASRRQRTYLGTP